MNKNTIIQELSAWHDAMLQAQARPFLAPLGLDMRFDAEAFDEDERQNSDCIALYRGGSVFEKVIRYWINYDAIADFFIREDDCSPLCWRCSRTCTIRTATNSTNWSTACRINNCERCCKAV